ncbi:hypothetical protein BD779DRAFT_1549720 [Infundibulicybe gibba]|nr:hypothetical protein BD779DRAFT_1549720 [Infundibulicybe gibba]
MHRVLVQLTLPACILLPTWFEGKGSRLGSGKAFSTHRDALGTMFWTYFNILNSNLKLKSILPKKNSGSTIH